MSEFQHLSSPVLVEIKIEPYDVQPAQHDPLADIKTEPGGAPPALVGCKVEPDSKEHNPIDASLVVVKMEPQSEIKKDSYGDDQPKLNKGRTMKGKQRNRPARGPVQWDENEKIKEMKRKRNQEYQRAWRQRQRMKGLKIKKYTKKKEEEKRKRHRESQRAYYQRTKRLKENYNNEEELSQKKFDHLPIKIKKFESNEDQGNVQCRVSQNLVLGLYEESHTCTTPKLLLHRNTAIPGDGNCLFHSLIHVLKLAISVNNLRRQLRDSPLLNSCHNPQVAYNILSSNTQYGDLDCLFLFTKVYNQNICVHYHYFNATLNNEDTSFCHFKANDSHVWVHLDLREKHFTPYVADEENERRQKQKNKEYSKRYRDRKRVSKLQTVGHSSQTAGSSTSVPYFPPVFRSQITDLTSKDAFSSLATQQHINFPYKVESSPDLHQPYSAFQLNSSAHRQFEKDFVENDFGHACDICDRLWFKKDLKYLLNDDATPNIDFIRTLLSNVTIQNIKVCLTCITAIQKRRIPPLAVYNGFKYPPIPESLKNCPLDLVTERLVSPRVPFVQILRLRQVFGRNGIFGQAVNVPIEGDTIVHQLPRSEDDSAVTVDLKRRKIHKSSVNGVVTRKIKAWLRYLKDTPLYKSYGVSVDDGFINDTSDVENKDGDGEVLELSAEEGVSAQQQTLLRNDDGYSRVAAGEGNAPKSSLLDVHAEELSFPQIYLGQPREFRNQVSRFMMASSELRRSDRRGATPQHLLYMAANIMRVRIKESLKEFKHIAQDKTKEQMLSDDSVETNLALSSIPNSAHYWEDRKKDLFSMIRQYGKPTVYFAISANEVGWPRLLQLLHNLKNNAEISLEEAAALHFIEKSTLVNEDAVTCAIYFNKLVEILLKILQSKRHSPFKEFRVLHYFRRIEFEHDGSSRAHVVAWLDNAPGDVFDKDCNKALDLIDFLISVSAAEASGDIILQTHKHTPTCYEGVATRPLKKCRFETPYMPVKNTMILTPMLDTENGFRQYKAKYNAIKKNLEKYEYNGFQSFYNQNDIASDDEYVKILRAGIKRPRVFPKREPWEKWNIPFNPFILNVVRSQTDFQFITEEYSCARVVELVNKTNRGVSDLRRQIIEIMNENPEFNLFDVTENINNDLLKQTEMTSQEAAWYLLREPMATSSAGIVYIPTILPVERRRIKKTTKEVSDLEDDTTELKESWFDKYEKRPGDLESVSLAQFVSKYYKNYKGDYVLRDERKVIRFRNCDEATDYNEFRREMVTLHLPFRDEEAEIIAGSRYLQLYEENKALILYRRKEFESNFDIEKTLGICRELCREEVSDDGEEIKDESHNQIAVLYDDSRLALCKLGADEKTTESDTSALVQVKSEPAEASLVDVKMECPHEPGELHTGLRADVVIQVTPQSGLEGVTIKREESCEPSQLLEAGSFNVFDMEFSVKEESPARPAFSTETAPQQTDDEDITSKQSGGKLKQATGNRKQARQGSSTVTLKSHRCDVCQRRFRRTTDLANHRITHTDEKPFQCHVCHHVCNRKANLLRHLRSHTGEKPFQCKLCPKVYSEKASLTKHLASHTGVRAFQCDHCQKAYRDRRYLLKHMRKHTGEKPRRTEGKFYLCTECGCQFTKYYDLAAHMRNHAGDGEEFQCDECLKSFDHKVKLLRHISSHNRKKQLQCEWCQKTCHNKEDLLCHVRKHTGERPFRCEVCSRAFRHKRYLSQHIDTHSGLKPYKCEVCKQSYNLKQTLAQHMKTHTNEKPFHCTVCQYKCKVKRSLIEHMRSHTGEKPFQCEVCHQSFKIKRLVAQHMRTHTGEKPFQCDVCEFQCSIKQSLSFHMRTHTGEKRFQCDLCQHRFIRKQNLLQHMRTHTGEKPFQCQVCHSRFRQKPSLVQHMRTHTGEKPFSCDLCQKRFTQKVNLQIHLRIHTGDKRFQCQVCQKAFIRKCQMLRHMKIHRGKPTQ